jgi:putative sterol carrier protein
MNEYIKKWGVEVTNVELKVNSIEKDQTEGEDPALKSISLVFKSLLNNNSTDNGKGSNAESKSNTTDAPTGQLPNELITFIQGLSSAFVLPNGSGSNQNEINEMIFGAVRASQTDADNIDEKKMTPFKILKLLEPLIKENMVNEIKTVYEFHIKTKNKQDGHETIEIFYLDLKNLPKGQIGHGNSPLSKVDCIIKLSEDDLHELLTDKLKPFTAYMSGRIEIEGDLQDVFKLKKLINSVSTVIASIK